MRKQDFLVHLIKTLTPGETRYFKLMSSLQGGEKEYMRLFEALEGKGEYDAKTLQKELGVSEAVLVERKRYLSQILLKSLRYYKDGDSVDSYLVNSVLEASELMERGLNDYALETLDKALAKAYADEALTQIPVIINKKLVLFHKWGRYDEAIGLEDELNRANQAYLELQEMGIFTCHITMFEQSRKGPEDFPIPGHRFLTIKPSEMLSARSQMAWFIAMNAYYLAVKKDFVQLLELVRTEAAFYESNPKLRAFAPQHFLASQIRLVTAEGQARNYKNSFNANERLIQLLSDSSIKVAPAVIKDMALFAAYCKANLLFNLNRFDEAVIQSEKVYEQRHLIIDYIQYSIIFDYAKVLMHLQRTADAIGKLEELLQINTELRSDLQPYIRPMLMLAQLDLGNYPTVTYIVKSTRAWMKRRDIADNEINIFISYCYSIASAHTSERREKWLKLKEAVSAGEIAAFDKEFNLAFWLEKKLAR